MLVNAVPAAAALLLAAVTAAPSAASAAAGPHAASVVKVSSDPYTNASAEHATEVEPDTAAAGKAVMSVFQVGRYAGGCSDNMGWAFSPNGGRSWQHGFMPGLTVNSTPPGPFQRVSDPTIAYNARFKEWIAAGLDCTNQGTPSVSVNISHDGTHWAAPVIVAHIKAGQAYDKDWITCDNTHASRFYGNCYTEWDVPSNGGDVVMSTSQDGGQHWSAPATTASKLSGIGGEPVVLPNGTAIVPIYSGSSVVDFRSTDGGHTWGRTIRIAALTQHGFAGGLRGPFFPGVAVDGAGRIYLTWPDCRFRAHCASNDMVLTTSTDGRHWAPVARIPIGPVTSTVDHLGGGIGVDLATSGSHARLGLFYYIYPKAKCTAATCRIDEAFVSSTDGGAHWSAQKILAGPFKLTQLARAGGFMTGDYQGAAVVAGGNAVSAFALGATATGGKKLNEAMYEPVGGQPITGGPLPASAAGARSYAPAKLPRIVH